MAAIKWFLLSQKKYLSLVKNNEVVQDGMYFLHDSKEYYYNGEQYMRNFLYYTGDLPQNPVVGRLYFNTNTLTCYTHNGSSWEIVIEPANVNVVSNELGVTNMVTGLAAKTFIDQYIRANNETAIMSIGYNPTAHQFTVTNSAATNNTTQYVVNEFGASLSRDASTGDIDILASDGTTILATINIPVDNYITDGEYDDTEKAIVLHMSNGADVNIFAKDIIDLYNQLDSATVDVSVVDVDHKNYIKFDVNLSQVAGNELVVHVAGTDVSSYYVADTTYVAATGNYEDGTKYYTDSTGSTEVDTSEFEDGVTDVSSYYVAETQYVPATGTYRNGTTYYTDNTGSTTVDTTGFVEATGNSTSSGLYFTMAHLMNKVATTEANKIQKLDVNGDAASTGRAIGGSTISATSAAQEVTQITEEALTNVKDDTEDELDATYLNKDTVRDQYSGFAAIWTPNVLTNQQQTGGSDEPEPQEP